MSPLGVETLPRETAPLAQLAKAYQRELGKECHYTCSTKKKRRKEEKEEKEEKEY